MKWLALTFGDQNCASTQYRLVQYQSHLESLGIHLTLTPANSFQDWNSLAQYQGVIIQKKLFPSTRVSSIQKRTPHLLYDIDDAIWHPHAKPHHWLTRWRTHWRLQSIARRAQICLTANHYIARKLSSLGGRTTVLPMGLDATSWTPRPHPTPDSPSIRLGWSGAPGNLPYLEALEPALAAVLQKHPQTSLTILCGKPPRFQSPLPFNHIPWKPGIEPSVVRTFDIGLLPLPESDFARGKSPIKALQYMASGVITVANPLDATTELFHEQQGVRFVPHLDAWRDTLLQLISQPQVLRQEGIQARKRFDQCFSTQTLGPRLAHILTDPQSVLIPETQPSHHV